MTTNEEMQAEMVSAASQIDYKVIGEKVYVNMDFFLRFVATVVQAQKTAANSNELTVEQWSAILGQQKLCAVLMALHDALVLRVQTDQALAES